ncbi:cytochrome b-c1 complex subunit 1, mitochondrial-like [Amyelois transitella]|uniref:cytochrome b-c1 complex subunit 1, mitochondrial-like n=1 Tax=Amyelois transitella TaxID=680683 RepID=UPI0029904BF8|nr:cytochrome b-c1 complex subunit 1, mitochondrial-like [Amyelois transitella]
MNTNLSFLKFTRSLVRHRSCGRACSPSEVPSNTKLTILPNGIRIATEETRSPLACISLFAEAGSRYEKACNNGIFHFIEHLIYKGFKSMTKSELQDLCFCSGIKFSATTGRELQVFSARCLPECSLIVIDIFSKMLKEPAFFENEIEMERYTLTKELIDADNDPKQVLFDYLHQTAFQGTPLAQRVIGSQRNLKSFDAAYCSMIIKDHYQPYKLAFVSSGCVKHDEMSQQVNTHFGCMQGDPAMQSDEGSCRFTGSEVIFRDDSLPYAHVALAFEAPGYNTTDYWTMLAAACMLGSFDRSQGRSENHAYHLAQAGGTGICERYEPFYIPYRDVGLWGVYFVAHKMHLEDMLYNVQKTLMGLCTMSQFSDVQRGVNAAKLLVARSVQGTIDSCHDVGFQIMYRCGRQSLQDSYDCLSSVNHNVLREVCDKYLYDRCPAVAAVGPTENLPEYNRIRAGMYWLRR